LNENKIDKKKSAETISYLKSKIGNFEVWWLIHILNDE
jgi:hypothetical protein